MNDRVFVALLAVALPSSCRSTGVPQAKLEATETSFSYANLPRDLQCKVRFLKKLGWTLRGSETSSSDIGGRPQDVCSANDLSSAQARAALTASISNAATPAVLGAQLDEWIAGPSSYCAYRAKLSQATGTALTKLMQNRNFTFSRRPHPGHDMRSVEGIIGTSATDLWEMESAKLSMYVQPKQSSAKGLEVLYDSKENTYADCYSGALAAATLAQMELFTPKDFAHVFTPGAVFLGSVFTTKSGYDGLGNPLDVTRTYDKDYNEIPVAGWTLDATGNDAMQLGKHAWIGSRGVVSSLLGETYLDHLNDRNENLLISAVSDDAQKQMLDLVKTQVSFPDHVLQISGSAWLIQAKAKIAAGGSEKTKFEAAVAAFLAAYPAMAHLDHKALAAQLKTDPIMNGVESFVHPLGLKTLRANIERLLTVNPRMPYGYELRPENFKTTMYGMYRDYYVQACQ